MTMKKESDLIVVEFKSVARGISVTDAMLKSALVELVIASSFCPGKYLSVLSGQVSALNSALKTAQQLGGMHLNSYEVVPGIDEKVTRAISGDLSELFADAVGIIESPQMASIIGAADVLVDAADVDFIDFRLARGCGVNSYFVFSGTFSAVAEANRQAVKFLEERGALLAFFVMPNPDRQVLRWLKSSLCRC
jgi:microcompartment protein CcmL/EutN